MKYGIVMAQRVPGWVPTVILLVVFGAIGPSLGSITRPLFLLACGLVGWRAWQIAPVTHVQSTLLLFVFTPLLRRLVDLAQGYDSTSLMILGPLIAMLPACVRALEFFEKPGGAARIAPLLTVAACVTYAGILTMIAGDWNSLAREVVRWGVPMAYAIALVDRCDPDEVLDGVAAIFAVILPIVGLYGIFQYVNPPDWDRYWMESTTILSIGYPLPYEVRVFSVMNGPASFATFTAIGLLLVWFRKQSWFWQILLIPAALALSLTLYRTAWTSLFAAMMFCFLFRSTRGRVIPSLIGIGCAIVVTVTLTPFGGVITERFATFSEGSKDGSANERIEQYAALWSAPDSFLFGVGFTTGDVGVAGTLAIDGMIVSSWYTMGIVVGLVCLAGLFCACATPMVLAFRDRGATSVLLGAIAFFFLAQIPLAGIASGEFGFLFWTFGTLAINLTNQKLYNAGDELSRIASGRPATVSHSVE